MDKVFKQNPNLKEYFKTSDGQKFYNPSDAKNHAKNLVNKEVETVVNKNVIDFVKAESKTVSKIVNLKKTDIGNTLDSPAPTNLIEEVEAELTDESADAPKVEEVKAEPTVESVEAPKVEEVKAEPTVESVEAPSTTKKKNSPSKTAK